MAETERIDQPKQASQDEAPRMDCPTCHVSHVGPTAEALRSRLSSVERDERLAEPSDEAIDQAREAMCFTAELGMDDVCPPRRKVIDGLRLAYAIDGVRAARSQGAVPSPDGPRFVQIATSAAIGGLQLYALDADGNVWEHDWLAKGPDNAAPFSPSRPVWKRLTKERL